MSDEAVPLFVILKNGLYSRPEFAGYTPLLTEAGRYTLSQVAVFMPSPSKLRDPEYTFMELHEAPEFAPACSEKDKLAHREAEIAELKKELDDVKKKLKAQTKTAVWTYFVSYVFSGGYGSTTIDLLDPWGCHTLQAVTEILRNSYGHPDLTILSIAQISSSSSPVAQKKGALH